jgi:lipoprotein signal peptidase
MGSITYASALKYLCIAIITGTIFFEKVFAWNTMKHSNKQYFINTGGIFNWPIYSHLAAGILLVAIVWLLRKSQDSHLLVVGLSLIVIGGSSNIFDRWLYGGVVDYWQLGSLLFNVADVLISTGIVISSVTLIKRPI